MTTIFLVFAAVIIFFVGLISPHMAGKLQKKTDKEAGVLKRWSNWLWDPITWWFKKTVEFTRKAIDKPAGLGKKTNKKM